MMLTGAGKSLIRSPWPGLILLMLALLVATFGILEQQRERSLQIAMENARDDIQFIKSILNNALQQHDFQQLGAMVETWGQHVRYTHELKVTAANGFVLGHYLRDNPVVRPYRLEERIAYSYQGLATLVFVKDLGSVDASTEKLRWQLLYGLIVVGLIFWRMTWLSLRRKREAVDLDQANTRLRQTADQLDATRAYLKNVFDAMPSTLVAVDEQTNITMWNRKAEEASRFTGEEVHGRAFADVFPEYAWRKRELEEAIDTGDPVRIERHLVFINGSPRFSEIMIYPLDIESRQGAVVRIDDVTQRVKMEQMMVQTEKMMTVGGLAAGMAHEINNPLSGVLQSSQNIMRRISPDLPANQATARELGLDLNMVRLFLKRRGILGFLEGIREAAERAGRIVADMLAFSRQGNTEFLPVVINELLDTVVRIAANDYDLKKTYDFKKITIIKAYQPNLPSVPCDRTGIEQVLLNLIKNAAQAMAGQEDPKRQCIFLRTSDEGDGVRIEVEDTGPGMTEEVQRRVFEPFFTTKPIGFGTGLGMSVSYYIITQQHKGTISVDSVLGEGCRFVIRLPYR